MLKWLVQRVEDPGGGGGEIVPSRRRKGASPGLGELITDDPLAVIDLKDGGVWRDEAGKRRDGGILGKKKRKRRKQEIYSVNRTNPLYDDREDRLLRGEAPLDAVRHDEDVGSGGGAGGQRRSNSSNVDTNTASSSSGYGSNGHPFSSATSGFSGINVSDRRINGGSGNVRDLFSNAQRKNSAISVNNRLANATSREEKPSPSRLARDKMTPSGRHVPLTLMQRNARYVSAISMFGGKPSLNVLDVARNEKYVSAIYFGDERLSRQRLPPTTEVSTTAGATTIRVMPAIGEEDDDEDAFPENFEHSDDFGDSIVTDSLLQMTSLSSKEKKEDDDVRIVHANASPMEEDSIEAWAAEAARAEERRPVGVLGGVRKSEDMDRVIMELTQAVINSRNVATITKAMKNSQGRNSSFRRGQILRNSVRAMKRSLSRTQGAGASAMRQLWEKSGMRTNGRKLLHSDSSGSNSSSGNDHGAQEETPSQRRRRRKNDRTLPGRRFPGKLSGQAAARRVENGQSSSTEAASSSSSSSVLAWSDEYQQPFKGSVDSRSQYYSELYAEVYNKVGQQQGGKGASHAGGARRIGNGGVETVDLDEDLSSLESGVSSQKRVTFSHDVKKGEKNNRDVVIDVGRLGNGASGHRHYWESYYGASGKFAGDPKSFAASNPAGGGGGAGGGGSSSAKPSDYAAVFSSPYFDYRRTHSRASNMSSSSSTNSKALAVLEAKRRGGGGGSAQGEGGKAQRRICLYWQSILTLVMLGCCLVVVIAIAVFFMGGGIRSFTDQQGLTRPESNDTSPSS